MKKRKGSPSPVPLFLDKYIPIKDVRQLVWAHLNALDREMIQCAHNSLRRPQFSGPFLLWAVREKHYELASWILDNHCNGVYCNYFKQREDLILNYDDDYLDLSNEAECIYVSIILQENTQGLVWCREKKIPLYPEDIYFYAAECGKLNLLKWLVFSSNIEKPCILDTGTFSRSAARNGHLHVLEFFREIGFRIERHMCAPVAIENGHDKVLNWLVEHGYY